MKVLKLDAFLAMPPGTIYAKGEPWVFSDLNIKGETLETSRDWFSRPLNWIDNSGDADQWSKLDDMLERGASYPIANYEQRDGCFDESAIFLVLEAADLDQLLELVRVARSVA